MLKNEYLVVKIGVDRAKNGPARVDGAEVRLPEVPALRFGGTDDSTVLARFIAPNEDVTLDMVVPDEWERYDADGREVSLMTTAGQFVIGSNHGG